MTTRNPFAKDLPEMAQGLREQGASETEDVSGTTSYTGVIRGADEAERPLTEFEQEEDADNARHDLLVYDNAVLTIEVERLALLLELLMSVADADAAQKDATIDRMARDRAERDATIERLCAPSVDLAWCTCPHCAHGTKP